MDLYVGNFLIFLWVNRGVVIGILYIFICMINN